MGRVRAGRHILLPHTPRGYGRVRAGGHILLLHTPRGYGRVRAREAYSTTPQGIYGGKGGITSRKSDSLYVFDSLLKRITN